MKNSIHQFHCRNTMRDVYSNFIDSVISLNKIIQGDFLSIIPLYHFNGFPNTGNDNTIASNAAHIPQISNAATPHDSDDYFRISS